MDFYAWWFSDPTEATARLRKLATRLGKRARFTIRQGNLRNLAADGERLRLIYNDAWKDNWGFVPFTKAEFEHLTKEMKPLLRPDFTAIAEVDGEPAGFVIGLPDINVALQKIDGRLTTCGIPIGLVKLLYHKARLKKARLIAMGVRPQFRRLGVAEMLVLRVMEEGMVKAGFAGELSMTLENNVMINRFLEAIGAMRYKTYRIYSKSIGRRPRSDGFPVVTGPLGRFFFFAVAGALDPSAVALPAKMLNITYDSIFPSQRWHPLPLANRRCLSPSRRLRRR